MYSVAVGHGFQLLTRHATGSCPLERRRTYTVKVASTTIRSTRVRERTLIVTLLWAHSGDSHFLEPEDLWQSILPPTLAERMPRSERVADDEEIVHVDGKSFRRRLPSVMTKKDEKSGLTHQRARQSRARERGDLHARIKDLDAEGIWGEVIYPSLGLWENMIEDRDLVRAAAHAENEWKVAEIQGLAPDRLVPAATIPLLDVDAAVAELQHAADLGLHRREPPHRSARRRRRLEP